MSVSLAIDNTQKETDHSEEDPTPALKLSTDEKSVIRRYVQQLKKRGFCKLTNSAALYTQLYNRHAGQAFTPCFISEDFSKWRSANHEKCRMPSVSYITYSLQHIVGQKFIPGGGEYWTDPVTQCTYANTYRPYKSVTDFTGISPLLFEYFERLLPVQSERHLFLQWVAHIFQRPMQRPSWHVMFTSEPGTGKGFLVEEILHPLLNHTQVISTYGKLTGQFSTTLEDNLLVLLDDCKARSQAQQTTLKSLLSEERAYVERKGLQGGMVPTYTRFILASNEAKPLNLEANERRWFVPAPMIHRIDLEETQKFVASLHEWLELPGSLDAVYNFFMTYSLEDFKHKFVVKTANLDGMVKLSKGIHGDLLADFIIAHPVFTISEWMATYSEVGLAKPPTKSLPALLQEVGYESSQKLLHGSRLRVCHPADMDLTAIRAAYPPPEF